MENPIQPVSEAEFFVLESLARPISTKMANDVMRLVDATAKRKPIAEGQLASLIGDMCLQTILLTLIIQVEEPGSKGGEDMIVEQYERYKAAAIKRWHKQDLKDARAEGRI